MVIVFDLRVLKTLGSTESVDSLQRPLCKDRINWSMTMAASSTIS